MVVKLALQIHKIYAAVEYAIIDLKPPITGIFQFQLN